MRGDGAPYDIFYNLVNGNRVLYPMIVFGLFILYITAIYTAHQLVIAHQNKTTPAEEKSKITV